MATIAQRPGEGSEMFCYKIVIYAKTPGLNWPTRDQIGDYPGCHRRAFIQ